jgi:aminoglycoside 6'-N-acetyltransferase I
VSNVRIARPTDRDELKLLRHALWPDGSIEEHARELEPMLAGRPRGTMPYVVFVAVESTIIGFAEVSLRSAANGCDPARPVAFLEGWFVSEEYRGRGVGADLLHAAEDWGRAQGCIEMGSDTWVDSLGSQRAHEALGFEEVDRSVNYRKKL